MADLFRIGAWLLLAFVQSSAHAALPVTATYAHPDGFVGSADAVAAHQQSMERQRGCNFGAGTTTYQISARNVTPQSADIWYTWVCSTGGVSGDGLAFKAPRVGGSCPDGAVLGTNAHGEQICTCTQGLREQDGQCTALPPACEQGYQWSDAANMCVIKPCKPEEIRVNGICVPDPNLCPDGSRKVNGKCEEKCPKAGTFAGEFQVSSINPLSFCENKCTVSIDSFLRAIKDGKVVEIIGMGYYTGGSCNGPGYTPPDPDKPNTPPDDDDDDDDDDGGGSGPGDNDNEGDGPGGSGPTRCPGGDCSGTGGTRPPGGDTDSGGNCPDGYYESGNRCYPEDPEETDPDSDGRCPPGSVKSSGKCVPLQPPSDDEQEEANEFCKKNPESPMCKKSTWQGSCMAGFSCDGDAIFCAIASEQHRRSCKLFDDKSAESELYEKEKGKQGEQTKDLPGSRNESLANRISTADALGGGQCIQDLTIVVAGRSVTLPMSDICPIIQVIGNIMVGVALLLAIRIVGRG